MRDIFNKAANGADSGALETKKALASPLAPHVQAYQNAVQASINADHRNNSMLQTIRARTQAQREWFEAKQGTIKHLYEKFETALEDSADKSGDTVSPLAIATILQTEHDQHVLAHTLSMPILTPYAHYETMAEFLLRAIDPSQSAAPRMIEAIENARVIDLFPSFEEIKIETEKQALPAPPAAISMIERISGRFKDRLYQETSEIKHRTLVNETIHYADVKSVESKSAKELRALAREGEADILALQAARHLKAALGDHSKRFDSAPLVASMRLCVPFLVRQFGEEAMAQWFLKPAANGDSPLDQIITDKDQPLEARFERLKSALSLFSQARQSEMLREAADSSPDSSSDSSPGASSGSKGWRQSLYEMAAMHDSAHMVRVGETAIINARQVGFASAKTESGEGASLRTNPQGRELVVKASADIVAKALTAFAQQESFHQDSPESAALYHYGAIYKSSFNAGKRALDISYFNRSWTQSDLDTKSAETILNARAQDKRFLQLSDKTIINTDHVHHAWITTNDAQDSYGISYILAGETHGITNITRFEKAAEMLAHFARKDDAALITETEMVRLSMIGNAWISDEDDNGGCRFKFAIEGKTYFAEMSLSDARDTLKLLVKDHGNVRIHKNEVIGPHVLPVVWFKKPQEAQEGAGVPKGLLHYVSGEETYQSEVTAKQAKDILAKITKKGDVIAHQESGLLRPALLGRLNYANDRLNYMVGGSNWYSAMGEEAAQTLFTALAQVPEFVALNSAAYVNLEKIGAFSYNQSASRLEYIAGNSADRWTAMKREDAVDVIDNVEAYGRALGERKLAPLYQAFDHKAMMAQSQPCSEGQDENKDNKDNKGGGAAGAPTIDETSDESGLSKSDAGRDFEKARTPSKEKPLADAVSKKDPHETPDTSPDLERKPPRPRWDKVF